MPPAPAGAHPAAYDFRVGVPDAGAVPARDLAAAGRPRAAAVAARRRRLRATRRATPGLRAAIARHVGVARAVRAERRRRAASPTAPSRRSTSIGRVLIDPGDLRGGRGARATRRRGGCSRSLGARVVGVPVDAEGLVVDALPARRPAGLRHAVAPVPARRRRCRCARRTALLAWADRHGAVDRRGRLRQRVPVRRPPARAAAEPRPRRAG